MAPVNELVHITQFNSRVPMNFVTQTHKSAILIEATGNKTRITNRVQPDEQFILNDKSKIGIDHGYWNRQFYQLTETVSHIVTTRNRCIVIKEALLKATAQ